jgi:hypothetical protein
MFAQIQPFQGIFLSWFHCRHWLSMERLQEEFERAVKLSEASSLAAARLLKSW